MVEELCKAYLEQKEYCDKLQYLSKYDYNEILVGERLDAWIRLIIIQNQLGRKLEPPKRLWYNEQD